MTKQLHISPNLSLPIEAVTQTFCILAKRGVGKTHAASVMAEEMLKLGQPIVVYDPTGAWHGLKSSKDGKHAGFPVVIFGGEHADVPLEETAGATIASVIVEKRFPAILDCSLLRKGARIRFMTDFCETLYHKNREALHFFVDEAQTIAPQNLKAMPEAARLLGAMEDIVLLGRRRGLGLTIISPRPAVVNTNLRSACEVIVAMQIVGPHDRKAISEWIDTHGDDEAKAKEMMATLSSLKRGQAYVWSPSWLGEFKKIMFRDRETFDSSATPKVGGRIVGPQKVAEVDLAKLGEQIKATVEKAKAEDPKELKRKIAELEKQTAKQVTAMSVTDQSHIKAELKARYETGYADGYKQAVERTLFSIGNRVLWDRAGQAAGQVVRDDLQRFLDHDPPKAPSKSAAVAVTPAKLSLAKPTAAAPRPSQPAQPRTVNIVAGDLQKGERLILTAIAQYPSGCNSEQIAVLTGYKATSRREYIRQLKARDYVTGDDPYTPTDAGIAALGDFEPLPTGDELQRYWLSKLTGGELEIFKVILAAHPGTVSHDQISEATTYKATSIREYTRQLKARRIVVDAGGRELVASEDLFG